jgi:hypothetical protein
MATSLLLAAVAYDEDLTKLQIVCQVSNGGDGSNDMNLRNFVNRNSKCDGCSEGSDLNALDDNNVHPNSLIRHVCQNR